MRAVLRVSNALKPVKRELNMIENGAPSTAEAEGKLGPVRTRVRPYDASRPFDAHHKYDAAQELAR